MDTSKARLSVDDAKCIPCKELICVGVCPEGSLELDSKGKPKLTDLSSCTLCEICINLCPQKALSLHRGGESKDKLR